MTGSVKWGIIGCGWVARDYVIPAMRQSTYAELTAVFDRDPAAARGLPYRSLNELLDADIDAIYIATPNNSHAELTICSALAGKHVLCEKPMATTMADAERMVRACEAAGVAYATAFDQRFHEAHLRLRGLLKRKTLGTVVSARIHYACWLPPEWSADNWRVDRAQAGGGAFIDLAPHGIDLISYLLDDDIVEFHCLKQTRAFSYAVDDGTMFTGRTESGCLISIYVAYNCRDTFPRRTLEITGTEAMLLARNTMGQTPGGSVELITVDGVSSQIPFEESRSPFLNQISAFSQCLLTGEPFPFTPERDLRNMQIISSCL